MHHARRCKVSFDVIKNFLFFGILFLISCGGGGSSSSPTNVESSNTSNTSNNAATNIEIYYNPDLPISGSISLTGNFDEDKNTYETTLEYKNQYGLDLIKASSAYARGATGRGATIGIMDSGVDIKHQELDGSNKLLSSSYLVYQDRAPTTDEKRHGSHVAGIALGERDGLGIHGVAFDAQLFFISIELGTAGETYEPATIDSTVDYSGIDSGWSQLEAEFVTNNVTVVNGSFGYQGNINDYNESNIRSAFSKTIQVLAQSQDTDQDKTIFVWAAGNGGNYADQGVDYSSPEVFGGLAYLIPELRNNTAAVVSIDQDGSISSFSNRCGVAKDFCIAAPGRSINSIYAQEAPSTDSYGTASGTSMAAPHVSGSIALLADFFDGQLGNTEVLQRLFRTANKSGIYSNSNIYGQGLIDLDAATKPIGDTMVATIGSSLSNLHLKEEDSYIGIIGPAYGNAISKRLGELSYVVFDEDGAPFNKSLNKRVLNNTPNINWLTSFQLNPNKRIDQRLVPTEGGGILKLGINENSLYDFKFPSLWANTENKLSYFSFEQKLTHNSKLFFGNGTSPNIYLISKKLVNYRGIPFLEFSSDGSFVGMDIDLPSSKSLLFSMFQGSHKDNQRFINTVGNSKGLLIELKDYAQKVEFSYQVGMIKDNSNLIGVLSEGGFGEPDKSFSSFLGIEILNKHNDFFFRSSLHIGQASSGFDQSGMIRNIDDAYFSSFDFGVYRENIFTNGDSLGIQIYQPLRSELANMNLNLPVGRTKDKEILFKELNLDLTPSGRQINSQLIYQKNGKHFTFFGKLGLVSNEFHEKESKIKPYFQLDIEFNLE